MNEPVIDTVVNIPIAQIAESPFNPRRTFGDSGLQELATDIKLHGILSPLLARARLVDPLAAADKMFDGFELIFGHRRFRAAQLAGLKLVPCIVRAMTDDQARRAQISENLAREDVHPIEEAEGLQALIDAGDSADQLAAQFGKSRSYVYGRLKLLQACEQIRTACLAGEISSEVALLIARLRTDKLQQKALQYIKGRYISLEDGGGQSYRSIRSLMAEHFTLDLKKPMFDPTDALLVPDAGTCGACPKRTGNAPEFADFLGAERINYGTHGADVCTDPDCFQAKKTAHLRQEAATLEGKGKSVIDGNKARAAVSATGEVKGAYVALKDVKKQLAEARTAAQRDSKIVPPLVVTIQDPRTGKTFEAVKRAELVAAGVKVATPKPKEDYEAQRIAREAETQRQEAQARAEQAARINVLQAVRDKIKSTERSAFDMSLIARAAYAGVTWAGKPILAQIWNCKNSDKLEGAIDTMTPDELMLFMFDCALVDDCAVRWHSLKDKPTDLLNVAAYYGVDVAAARGEAPAKPASTPSTAARAAKGMNGKAEKKAKPARSAGAGVDLVGDPIGESQSMEAGSAGEEAKDEPADAGVERDPNTSDMFQGELA